MTQQSVPPEANLRPLDPGLFSVHGRDDQEVARKPFRQLGRFGLRLGAPYLEVVDHAVFVPPAHKPLRRQAAASLD